MTAPKPINILDDLLGGAAPVSRETTAGLPIYHVPLNRLVDNTYQPRQHNDSTHVLKIARSLLDLAGSLPETRGLQQVPIARLMRWADSTPVPAAAYSDPAELRRLIADREYVVEMAFGHSRRLAFEVLHHGAASVFPEYGDGAEQLANLPDHDPGQYSAMPVLLLPLDDRTMWQQAVIENAARQDISSIEEARTLQRATSELGMTIEEAGRTLGKSRSAASNLLRLLDLPEEYQQAIIDGTLSETHGRALLAMKPAMHLVEASLAGLGAMTRRELEEHVAKLIAACYPLAPQPRTGYRSIGERWDGTDIISNQFDPPAWPLDWQPEPADPAVVGPCTGCRFRVTFSGDPGPRCASPRTKGVLSCYSTKDRAWSKQQMDQQRAAIEQLHAAPAAGSPTPAHTSKAEETPAAAALAAPVHSFDGASEAPTWFRSGKDYTWSSAPAALIDKGLCGPEKCKCFVLAYNQHAGENNVRPDEEHAPNMCYGCTSAQRLARRKQELEHGDMNAKRAAIKAENAACEEMLRDAFYRLTAQDIWHNAAFLRDLLKAGSLTSGLGQRASQLAGMDALTIQEIVWMQIARQNCTSYTQFTVDGEQQHWQMDKVDAWLRKLLPDFTRPLGGPWADLRAGQQQPTELSPAI
jgi:hypothetical protein